MIRIDILRTSDAIAPGTMMSRATAAAEKNSFMVGGMYKYDDLRIISRMLKKRLDLVKQHYEEILYLPGHLGLDIFSVIFPAIFPAIFPNLLCQDDRKM